MTSLNLGRLLILNLEGRIRISSTRGCGTGCKITRLERNGVGSVIQGCFWTKCRTVQRQRSTVAVRIAHQRLLRYPQLNSASQWVISMRSVKLPYLRRQQRLVATVVSQSFSWMLKPNRQSWLLQPASGLASTWPNWTVWSTEPASTAQAALTTSPLKWTVPPFTVVVSAKPLRNWGQSRQNNDCQSFNFHAAFL